MRRWRLEALANTRNDRRKFMQRSPEDTIFVLGKGSKACYIETHPKLWQIALGKTAQASGSLRAAGRLRITSNP